VTTAASIPDLDAFLRFAEDDDLGMVLRSHLAVEAVLNAALKSASPGGLNELDRLRFMQKVDVCIALGRVSIHLRRPFEVANKIRNRFAHSLAAELTNAQGEEFLDAFEPSVWDAGFVRRAYFAARRETSGSSKVGMAFAALYMFAAIDSGLTRDLLAPYLAARAERDRARRPSPTADDQTADLALD
jgi:hypothetical protein